MGNYTFSLIKPEAVHNGYTGNIIAQITSKGFRIKALRMLRLSKAVARAFYALHKDKDFYDELTDYMRSGPIVAMILEKENAVAAYRQLIGATDPKNAAEGTIRNMYGADIQSNAVHGSDSDENAALESNFFFSVRERYSVDGDIVI